MKKLEKPNIVCLVLDHVTFRHYKTLKGAKPILNTYEKLASNGVEFENAHSVHPLCLPARATMMTGVYTHKHKKYRNTNELPDDTFPLLNKFFENTDYKIGYFGKNHSGYDFTGFEGCYSKSYDNPYHMKEYKDYLKRKGLANPIYEQEWGMLDHDYRNDKYDLTVTNNFNAYSAGVLHNDERVHESHFLTSLASDWIEENKNNPYIVRVDVWGPHHAYQIPEKYADLIDANDIQQHPSFLDDMEKRPEFVREFLAEIKRRNYRVHSWNEFKLIMKRAYEHYSFIDKVLGEFIDNLPNKENTVVIMTADHGDAIGCHGGMVDKAGDVMEELMHIPLVISVPNGLKNVKSQLLASNLDLVPTILDFAGIPVPEYMDGKSLLPLTYGNCDDWREDLMVEHYGHFKVKNVQRALYYKNYKYVATQDCIHELYDLENDPFELDNLIDNPDYSDVLAEMKKRLLNNMDKYSDDSKDLLSI